MLELGIINREISSAIAKQGHGDLLLVVDAGFPIPKGVEVIDISLSQNKPMVTEVLAELKNFFSVEKIILARQTKESNPSLFKNISTSFGPGIPIETVEHSTLKEMSKTVKAVIRTGDFTAYGNVILVSGAGKRWFSEK
jgi:D-ribose pyranase